MVSDMTPVPREDPWYLYGLVRHSGPLPPGMAGLGGMGVSSISYLDLTMLASPWPEERYEPAPEHRADHQRVLEQVLALGLTPIPVRPGTLASSPEQVKERLRQHYDSFHSLISSLEDQVEMGLEVFWEDIPFAEVMATERDLLPLEFPEALGYEERIELGRRLAGALDRLRDARAEELLASLKSLATRCQRLPPSQESQLLEVWCLVPRRDLAEYQARLESLRQQWPRLQFRIHGPQPPGHFMELVI